ncbi:MAG: dehypoxanthine futalosine cyclase [Acidobacteria bacterium]|nr:dehypoxanthine futalosine cyclase [Acidobacteriota bacterium]
MSSLKNKNTNSWNRLDKQTTVELYNKWDLTDLATLADRRRFDLVPERRVTYILDRNINYTNICKSGCKFCAYYRENHHSGGYLLDYDVLAEKIRETLELGGTQVLLQGGLHPDLDINYYETLFKKIKSDFDIHLHALSPPEVIHISETSGITIDETLERLIKSGLDSIPGGGAEILVDRVRKEVSPNKYTVDEWLDVMRKAHKKGLKTTATMMFGHIETIEERIEHMDRIRSLQDETGGFTAFIPWTFQPANTKLDIKKVSALEYLRTLALARLYLDNIKHLQVSWVTQGPKIAQVALGYGADDFGSLMIEENVVKAAGVTFRMQEKDIVRLIEDYGLKAERRDMLYNILGEPLWRQN